MPTSATDRYRLIRQAVRRLPRLGSGTLARPLGLRALDRALPPLPNLEELGWPTPRGCSVRKHAAADNSGGVLVERPDEVASYGYVRPVPHCPPHPAAGGAGTSATQHLREALHGPAAPRSHQGRQQAQKLLLVCWLVRARQKGHRSRRRSAGAAEEPEEDRGSSATGTMMSTMYLCTMRLVCSPQENLP